MPADRPVRTVFLGSGAFALPVAEAVAGHPALDVVGVVSAPDRPAGRGQRVHAAPVVQWARDRGTVLFQPLYLRDPGSQREVLDLGPGLLVVADYGQIVPAPLLDAPPYGALNVHPSLLPRHRGASPLAATILEGDMETGVTVFRMDAGLDTGPIVGQERTAVLPSETAPELTERLARLGAHLLSDLLELWIEGAIVPRPQADAGVTTTRRLRRADGRIDWSRDAVDLERQVRAYQPWPGSFAPTPLGTVVVWEAAVRDATTDAGGRQEGHPREPGTVVPADGGIGVVAGSGILELLEVQLAGRARMSGRDLRNGYPRLVGERLT